jgi:hypothetical protein
VVAQPDLHLLDDDLPEPGFMEAVVGAEGGNEGATQPTDAHVYAVAAGAAR